MSKGKNHISLIGHVGADAKTKTFPSGKKVAEFTLVTNDGYKDASGEWKDKPNFHNIKAFGRLVEIVEKYVKKGGQVGVDGSIDYNKHEDKQGVTKYYTAILCRDLYLLGGTKPQSSSPSPTTAAPVVAPEEDDDAPF